MPLNFIESPQDYNTLLLYFDSGDTNEEITLPVSELTYYIFPASTKTFVFGVGQNYDDNTKNEYPYRYELSLPLKDSNGELLTFAEDQTVTVTINGKVNKYNSGDDISQTKLYNSRQNFGGEFYDGAYYEVPGKDSYFHPLSKDNITDNVPNTENVKQLSCTDGVLSNNRKFVFAHIQEPYTSEASDFKNDFRIQCVTTCANPDSLLVIKDFNITTTVSASQ